MSKHSATVITGTVCGCCNAASSKGRDCNTRSPAGYGKLLTFLSELPFARSEPCLSSHPGEHQDSWGRQTSVLLTKNLEHAGDSHVPSTVAYHGSCGLERWEICGQKWKRQHRNYNIVIPSEHEMFLQEIPDDDEGLPNPLLPLRNLLLKWYWSICKE